MLQKLEHVEPFSKTKQAVRERAASLGKEKPWLNTISNLGVDKLNKFTALLGEEENLVQNTDHLFYTSGHPQHNSNF